MPVHVLIVRHGETDANIQGIIQGQLDTSLNEVGLKQADLVGEALQDIHFGAAFSSDLQRAKTTAEKILEYHWQSEIELRTDESLRERFMGELQGEVWTTWSRPSADFESTIELSSAFASRAIKWWKKALLPCAAKLDQETSSEESIYILVVSHGGLITTLIQELYGSRHINLGPGVKVGNCLNTAIAEIVLKGNKGTMIRYGDTTHLVERAVEINVDEVKAV